MGKKGKRSGFGGGAGGGGGNAKGGPRGSPAAALQGMVVVNPALMQSMLGAARPTNTAGKGGPGKPGKQQQQKKTAGAKKDGTGPSASGNSGNSKKRKDTNDKSEPEQRPVKKLAVHEQQPVKKARMSEPTTSRLVQLQVAREDHCLAALYWVLLTREIKRSAVVAIPNLHATLTPSLLAQTLKNLGFQAASIHSKMALAQRKQAVARVMEQSKPGSGAAIDKIVLVTNEHHLSSAAACTSADLVTLGSQVASKGNGSANKFASVFTVHADPVVSAEADSYATPLTAAAIPQLQARLKLAMQIATIVQRLHGANNSSSAGAGAAAGSEPSAAETKWITKFAKGADLSDDDDDDNGKKPQKSKKTKATLSPDEQRLRALNEKLLVLLARELPSANASASGGLAGVSGSSSSDDAQHRAEKLRILGIATLSSAAVGTSVGDGERRLSAQTQWLDQATGTQFGGDWQDAVRHGASKDATSLAARQRICDCLSAAKKQTKGTPTTTTQLYLQQWRPNKQPVDVDAWGGAYGKVCGHNEVVMHHVRPFFPQEVVNSRVCSKRHPAPGNTGFDGCLEFLRLACRDGNRCMTVWDAELLLFFTASGRVSGVKKLQFLTLPLAGLQTLMACMRQWTLSCQGEVSPVLLLEGIRMCCRLGAEELTSSRLQDAKLMRRILAFAIGGSTRVWKQISKMPRPIAKEVVYE